MRWRIAATAFALLASGCGSEATPETTVPAEPTTAASATTATTAFVPGTLPDSAVTTYTSDALGFAIDHPIDWVVQEEAEAGIVSFFARLVQGDAFVENYNVAVEQLPGEMDLAAYAGFDARRLAAGIDGYEVVGGGESVLDGVPAVTVVFDGTVEGVELRLFRLVAIRDNQSYAFTFFASREEFENFLPVIDQMLGGFEFRA